ncbi:F-box only protein 7 [Acromyrmex echinatior]|uniref:F-box only protein 7 n=1 Tax=Acromyrmex echinatior TaxID=103372 RepID=F4X4U6_ACREC|nr:F-box only protein 7 [Acromyrmex echinatior]
MEQLRSLNRTVDITEPILAEDSTFSTIALSLRAVLEQLDENAKHHDYLVALLLVLLAESGFGVSEQNTRLVYIPKNWKSQETGVYEIYLTLRNVDHIRSKLIVITCGDKLVLNILSHIRDMKIYSMVIQTLKYVNPYTNNLCLRYMNLKEISHRFKDKLVIPLRTDILLVVNFMGPSLESLPIELRTKIVNMLDYEII